jgi:hypothetical protein
MALLKKKEAKPELAAEIGRLQADLIAFIEDRVMALKQSRDGASLPVEVIRQQLVRGDTCPCRIVQRLLDE